MNVLIRVASSPDLDDAAVLNPLFQTEGWQTLMTFTRESAREFDYLLKPPKYLTGFVARLPSTSAPTSGHSAMEEDIPPEIFDQIAREQQQSGSVSRGNIRICPHCTFENNHSGGDCEVCGLPLDG